MIKTLKWLNFELMNPRELHDSGPVNTGDMIVIVSLCEVIFYLFP